MMCSERKKQNTFEKIQNTEKENTIMKRTLRNLVIGAVMAATVITASATAFAGQYVQTDMNFRSGASKTSTSIGCVPAGAEVEVLGSTNGWDLIRYNGTTGYIHGGNLGSSFVAKQQAQPAAQAGTQTYNSTQSYFDNNWTGTAANMNNQIGAWKTVKVNSGYLALRRDTAFDQSNEIGQLYSGDQVEIQGNGYQGSYVFVYSPKYGCCGWVNAGFLG